MPRGRPVAPIVLSENEEVELRNLAHSRTLPHSLVQRAQIVLACAEGISRLGCDPALWAWWVANC